MKAQFFILGAVLLCALFYVGLPLYGPGFQAYREDLSLASSNLETEFPKALNLGLKEGSGTGSLEDFSRFAESSLAGRNMRLSSLWVVAQPQGSDVLVTVGNFMGQDLVVTISVEGNEQNFNVQDDSSQSSVFPGTPDSFQVSVRFPGRSWSGTWVRDKASLYCFFQAERGSDKVVEEVEA